MQNNCFLQPWKSILGFSDSQIRNLYYPAISDALNEGVVIKPRPGEATDYSSIFPECEILPTFGKAINFTSTAISLLPEEAEIIWINPDNEPKLAESFGNKSCGKLNNIRASIWHKKFKKFLKMISIVVCSRFSKLNEGFVKNISSRIGCNHEILPIDNSNSDYNIFTAYNEGVRRAKGNILCFAHEDILFHSSCWGRIVENRFAENENVGLIGVIGGHFIPATPSSYWEGGATVGSIIQGYSENENYETKLIGKKPATQFEDVAVVDGLFMCARKSLFDKISFDAATFHGFHCYDMDICLQVLKENYSVEVARDILIEHKSPGDTNSAYLKDSDKLFIKWSNYLPIICGDILSQKEIAERTKMVKFTRDQLRQINFLANRLNVIEHSYAYRIGRFLLKPLRLIKRG